LHPPIQHAAAELAELKAEISGLKSDNGQLSMYNERANLENKSLIKANVEVANLNIDLQEQNTQLRAELNNKRKVMELLGYILGEDGDLVDNAQHLRAELDEAIELIETVKRGLIWWFDRNPTQVEECDYDAMKEIDAFLERMKETK
jgi:predicted RNase H-like nuclease (RuvC/YqgF family)